MNVSEINQLQLFAPEEIDPYKIHREILSLCYRKASRSPDKSTQIGSVIVNREGYVEHGTFSFNGFCFGWIPTAEDFERPRKYSVTVHAERRAVYKAANVGITLHGCTLYSTWGCCAECSQSLVESGISTLIRHLPPEDGAVQRWLESVQLGDELLKAGGVKIVEVQGPIPNAAKILRNGVIYDPAQ